VYSFKEISNSTALVDMLIRIVVRDHQSNPVSGIQFRIEISGASPARSLTGTSDGNGRVEICLNDAYQAVANLDITTDVTSSQYPDPALDDRRTTVQASSVNCQ